MKREERALPFGLAPVGIREEIVRVVQLLTHGVAVGRLMGLLTTNMELTDKISG